jgi:hypothetical protein
VQRNDRRLDLIGTGALNLECALQQAHPLDDLGAIPPRSILILEQH